MKTKHLLKDQDGFTLIEIIAVLVILGILAAVAVPKFFDLQDRARSKAIYTAMSEMKVRVNQHFAQKLLEGYTWTAIWDTQALSDIGTDLGRDFIIDIAYGDTSPTGGYILVNGNYVIDYETDGVTPRTTQPITNERLDLPRYK